VLTSLVGPNETLPLGVGGPGPSQLARHLVPVMDPAGPGSDWIEPPLGAPSGADEAHRAELLEELGTVLHLERLVVERVEVFLVSLEITPQPLGGFLVRLMTTVNVIRMPSVECLMSELLKTHLQLRRVPYLPGVLMELRLGTISHGRGQI